MEALLEERIQPRNFTRNLSYNPLTTDVVTRTMATVVVMKEIRENP